MNIQETVQKFLQGDVIVDRRNPFKVEDDDDVHIPPEEFNTTEKIEDRLIPLTESSESEIKRRDKSATHNDSDTKRPNTNRNKSLNRISKNSFTRKQHPHQFSFSQTNCINDSQNIETKIPIRNLKQIGDVSIHTRSRDDLTLLEDLQSVSNRQDTSDAYASVIELLTMENKSKKRSSLKKIFPSIFSSHKKSNHKNEPSSDESCADSQKDENDCKHFQRGSPPHRENAAVASSPENGEVFQEIKISRNFFEEKDSYSLKKEKDDCNVLKKENNFDKSPSSSSSTLVSEGLPDRDTIKNKIKAKIPMRKSSLKNEFASNSNSKNNNLVSNKQDKYKFNVSQSVSKPYKQSDKDMAPLQQKNSQPTSIDSQASVYKNNELVIIEPGSSHSTDQNKIESKLFRPVVVKSSFLQPESQENVYPKNSNFFYHNQRKLNNAKEFSDKPDNNKRNEFKSLDYYNSNNGQSCFADIVSVGAEVKISTTDVNVSPKKESEVKQRKQLRARSLSPTECKKQSIRKIVNTKMDSAEPTIIINKDRQKKEDFSKCSDPIFDYSDLKVDNSSYVDDTDNISKAKNTKPLSPKVKGKKHPIINPEMQIYRPVLLGSVTDNLKGDFDGKKNIGTVADIEFAKKSSDSLSELDYQKFNQKEMATSSPVNPKSKSLIVSKECGAAKSDGTMKKSLDNLSPDQKIKNLQNVEAFYWQQLKKIKHKQEQDLIRQALSSNDDVFNKPIGQADANSTSDSLRQAPWRCRSVSPGFARNYELRSNSLPHFNELKLSKLSAGNEVIMNQKSTGVQPVPLERTLINPNFIRGSHSRYTVGSTSNIIIRRNPGRQIPQNYRDYATHMGTVQNQVAGRNGDPNKRNILQPIFKKGSLSAEPSREIPKEKRVSFSNIHGLDASKLNSVYENLSSSQMSGAVVPEIALVHPTRGPLQIYRGPLDPIYSRLPVNQTIDPSSDAHIYGKISKTRSEGVYATIENRGIDSFRPSRRDLASSINEPKVYRNSEPILKDSKLNTATGVAKNLFFRRVNSARSSGSHVIASESESGSEAGEVQRIMLGEKLSPGNVAFHLYQEEDWNPDGRNRGDGSVSEGGRGRLARRDDPRRHTLGGDLLRAAPPHSALVRGMDIEPSMPRGYAPPSSAMLFDDDPGIMSEVETASTGFRRGGKQRSSLPVVRTPSKTLERPLGLVFLQYRSETKRALLPNEITSIDTVKALFVRSFNKQLTMEYLDSPLVKIYIHDSSKDMFYELEDLRSHLRDIRDRSVLRLFESADVSGGAFPGTLGSAVALPPPGPSASGPSNWEQDQNYFSEPEFESDYHHQHIHKSKVEPLLPAENIRRLLAYGDAYLKQGAAKPPAYYMGGAAPSTLPRGGSAIRAYSPAGGPPIPADRMKPIPGPGAPPKPLRAYGSAASITRGGSERCFPFVPPVDAMRAPDQLYSLPADRIHNDGYMSSPERGSRGAYEEPYYTQYVGPPRGGMTPVIDEEVVGDHPSLLDDQFSLYGLRPTGRVPPYDGPRSNAHSEDVQQRMRVEHMERQLANLTGLVQKALQTPAVAQTPREFMATATHFRSNQGPVGVLKTSSSTTSLVESMDPFLRSERPPKLGKGRYHKSVSFEKSVSFSDEPPDMNSPKQHSPQNSADTKPPKPAIKSSTLPRMSSQERDRLKPVPPPKPKALVPVSGVVPSGAQPGSIMAPIEYYSHLRTLHRRCKELRSEMRNLRRMTLAQAHTMRELICDTFAKFKNATMSGGDFNFHEDSMRLAQEEEDYKQEMLKLEADLCDLENTVEHLRGSVIHSNRKTRVNMLDVERMALILSKSSKTVADLKVRFPSLHEGMKGMLGNEMEKVVREEKFLKEEPERLELALRRCKKLTGTLVTLKRLASVQEQRLPCDGRMSPDLDDLELEELHAHENSTHNKGSVAADSAERSENALDALLDELQTFARPPEGEVETAEGEEGALLRRLRGPASPDTSPAPGPRATPAAKPPVPERNPELLQLAARRAPPPPPPRTSSRSPLASPAYPAHPTHPALSPSNSSSCDSVDSQEGSRARAPVPRHDLLELRHQELLKKQKALQEQYARLQQIQRGGNSLAVVPPPDLKKTGSESNLVTRMGLNMAPMSGSLTHLAGPRCVEAEVNTDEMGPIVATTSKIYETDIL